VECQLEGPPVSCLDAEVVTLFPFLPTCFRAFVSIEYIEKIILAEHQKCIQLLLVVLLLSF